MIDSGRIDELKRRVRQDPASISFAALAEEYRRAGHYQEAIEICREGLRHRPGYVSARVTLGRALLEVGEFEEAARELESVLSAAPDNIVAMRTLEEARRRSNQQSLPAEEAPDVKPVPPEIPRIPVSQLSKTIEDPVAESPASRDHVHATAEEPALAGLEEFLEAILRARRETDHRHEQRR